jgi:divalent metal cation (Fe/Co/Zn/Cd) transporter
VSRWWKFWSSGAAEFHIEANHDVRTLDLHQGVIGQHAAGAREAHDVRTRNAARVTFSVSHLVVPGGIHVADAHDIFDRIEAALKAGVNGQAMITIHVEFEAKAKP